MRRCFVQLCDINADSHSKEKREKLSKRTKNTKLEIFSSSFCEEKMSAKFCSQVDHQKPKKEEKRKNSLVLLFF